MSAHAPTVDTPIAFGEDPLFPPFEDGIGVFFLMFPEELRVSICDGNLEGTQQCVCCVCDLPVVEYGDFWFPVCYECFRVEAGDRNEWRQRAADIENVVRERFPEYSSYWKGWWDLDEDAYYVHCVEEEAAYDSDSDSDYVPDGDGMEIGGDAPPAAAQWDPVIQENIHAYYEQQHDAEVDAILNGLHEQINDDRVIDLRTPEPQVEVIDLRTPEPEVEANVVHEPIVRRREGPLSPVTNEDRAFALAMLRDLQGAGTVDDPVVL